MTPNSVTRAFADTFSTVSDRRRAQRPTSTQPTAEQIEKRRQVAAEKRARKASKRCAHALRQRKEELVHE